MKKIINGRMYNTDTAQSLASFESGRPGSFENYYEVLFRKKNGEFFLYGEGSCLTKYAVQIDSNNVSGGSAIEPMSEYEARVWMEENASAEEYIEVFGEPEE